MKRHTPPPFKLALTLSLFLCMALAGGGARAGAYDAYYERIQAASWHADLALLAELSRDLNASADANPGAEAALAAAYADYRLANAGMAAPQANDALIAAALERARQRLEALGAQEAPAEALALLAGVYGLTIARSPAQGALLGAKAGSAIGRAARLAPDNPRVRLFAGIGRLYTPALFGGDRAQSIADFDGAIAQLGGAASAVNWGLDDAYIWRGIALKAAGRPDQARASFEQALSVAPEQAWARKLLAK